MNIYKKVGAVSVVSLIAAPAFALDAGVTTALTAAGTDVGVVGAAILLIIGAIVAFKFIKRAM